MKAPSFWHQDTHILGRLLAPLGELYYLFQRIRQRFQPHLAPSTPVICVGNVIAGGAGKTPTVLALTRLLQSLGHRPQIITRGYGGSYKGPIKVAPGDDWRQTGDEPLILSRQAPVWVAKDRIKGCLAAIETGAELLLCDDGFQDMRLRYHTRLLVVDGPTGLGNGRCLPAGPLREPWADALLRADAVLIIGADAQDLDHQVWAADLPRFHGRFVPDAALANWLRGRPVAAFAGLGRPEKFRDTLQELGADIQLWETFPDHHPYREDDLHALLQQAKEDALTVVTTEKDAVKLPPALRDGITVLPVTLELGDPKAWQDFWQGRLEDSDA